MTEQDKTNAAPERCDTRKPYVAPALTLIAINDTQSGTVGASEANIMVHPAFMAS